MSALAVFSSAAIPAEVAVCADCLAIVTGGMPALEVLGAIGSDAVSVRVDALRAMGIEPGASAHAVTLLWKRGATCAACGYQGCACPSCVDGV